MIKKILIGFSIVAFLLIIGLGLFWFQYYLAMKESNEQTTKTKCKDEIEAEFFGTIEKVERYENDDFMHNNFFSLKIRTTDSLNRFRTYQFNLEKYPDVLAFAKAGQMIRKIKGQESFLLKTKQGQEKDFTIPYCRLLED